MAKYSNMSHIPQCSGPFNVRPSIPKCFVIQTEVTVLLEYFVSEFTLYVLLEYLNGILYINQSVLTSHYLMNLNNRRTTVQITRGKPCAQCTYTKYIVILQS